MKWLDADLSASSVDELRVKTIAILKKGENQCVLIANTCSRKLKQFSVCISWLEQQDEAIPMNEFDASA